MERSVYDVLMFLRDRKRMNWGLNAYHGVIKDGGLWFSNNTFNGLFRLDLDSSNLIFQGFFPDEDLYRWGMHKRCFCFENKLLFIPALGSHIHVYDLTSKSFLSIDIEKTRNESEDMFSDAVLYNNKVYLFPMHFDEDLFVLDLDELSLTYVPEFKEQVNLFSSEKNSLVLTRCQVDEKGCFHFALYDSNVIAVWNCTEKRIAVMKSEIQNMFSAHFIDGGYWIIPNNGCSLFRLEKGSEAIEYNYTDIRKAGVRYFNRVVKMNGNVMVLPAFGKDIVYVDSDILRKVCTVVNNNALPFTYDAVEVGKEVWVLPFAEEDIYVIGEKPDNVKTVRLELFDKQSRVEILRKIYKKSIEEGILCENEEFAIGEFSSYILRDE